MDKKLIFKNFPYGKDDSSVDVYYEINAFKRLNIFLFENHKEIKKFKLVPWKGGMHERIYIHDLKDTYKQLGYMALLQGNKIEYKLRLDYNLQNLFFNIYKYIYSKENGNWNLNKKFPISFQQEKKLQIMGNNHKKAINEQHNNLKSTEPPRVDVQLANDKKNSCKRCRDRNICFKKYNLEDDCEHYREGAAIMSDYSQYDSRY